MVARSSRYKRKVISSPWIERNCGHGNTLTWKWGDIELFLAKIYVKNEKNDSVALLLLLLIWSKATRPVHSQFVFLD